MKQIFFILFSLISTISFVNAQCSEDNIKRDAWDIVSTDTGSFSKPADEVDYKQGWEKAWGENNSISQYSLEIITEPLNSKFTDEEEKEIKALLTHYYYHLDDKKILVRVEYILEEVLKVVTFIAYEPSTTSSSCGLIGVSGAITTELKD